jgi:nitroreductase
MNDIIRTRRSIRRFSDQQVSEETLTELFEAARYSPSWGNLQCWELVVVKNGEDKKRLAGILSAKNPATLCTEAAPVLIAVCGDPQRSGFYKGVQVTRYGHWFLFDLGIITQTLCLKAWELGLGSVIVGSFDHKVAEEILQVPAGKELVAIICLGYPDQEPAAPKRREISGFVHKDHF